MRFLRYNFCMIVYIIEGTLSVFKDKRQKMCLFFGFYSYLTAALAKNIEFRGGPFFSSFDRALPELQFLNLKP